METYGERGRDGEREGWMEKLRGSERDGGRERWRGEKEEAVEGTDGGRGKER